ncbi:ImmA/IrrE family metallo-endopeptidase [Parageobacillus sp. KH3-4]|uniref:ImmA/IrrE family metallo-endopeptidase n=1 Tax=Parageobacillus sp. KH3-4 TaxID=2916802 RepID=UPI001FCAB147|nr:ImmA/IrrE family metallo-endopeptidase [Parageobacillus sp. KH3-4]BDG48820.1 phage-like element PBSX protein XkdA [Parageobacillus sp. KH3-4]
MELRRYYTTALEDWVTKFYTRLNIFYPCQIDPSFIARKMNIFLREKPFPSTHQVVGRFRCIVVDSRLSKEEKREAFFHELCHILRHVGIQSMMPEAFRELQERDANHFTKYAAIPFHMLRFIDWHEPYIVDYMSNMFKVTPELCEERLTQVKNRILIKQSKFVSANLSCEKSVTF